MKTKICFLVALLFLLTPYIFNQTIIPAGEVHGNWLKSGSPYHIMGDIGIPAGQVLTIQPGVKVEFQGHYNLSVRGQLLAEGNESDIIMFTINDSTGFHDITIPDGGWGGIRFAYSAPDDDTSRISYSVIAFGKANGETYPDQNGGAIGVMEYPNLFISYITFYSNAALHYGGALAVTNANITLRRNIFQHNQAETGGAIAINGSDLSIRNCFFIDNTAANSGGAIGMTLSSNGDISSNLMAGNFADYGAAIQLYDGCNPTIRNNLIYSNAAYEEGGAVDLEKNCQASFINNTITGNYALFGGGIDVEVNSSPTFHNDIIWDNTAFVDGNQVHLFSEDSDPDFYYCDIQGGIDSIGTWYGGDIYLNYTGIYENNIDMNPKFVSAGDYPYQINDYSPCIDAGTPDTTGLNLPEYDLAGEVRIYNDWVDMGAYEWNPLVGTEEFEIQNSEPEIRCYPNPFNTSTAIEYELTMPSIVQLTVYDYLGKLVDKMELHHQAQGKQQVVWNAEGLPGGIYFCVLKTESKTQTMKMIKLK